MFLNCRKVLFFLVFVVASSLFADDYAGVWSSWTNREFGDSRYLVIEPIDDKYLIVYYDDDNKVDSFRAIGTLGVHSRRHSIIVNDEAILFELSGVSALIVEVETTDGERQLMLDFVTSYGEPIDFLVPVDRFELDAE